ncbi:hypothetical protein ACSW8S_17340 (plasmid) [Clostridium perfringens]
MKNCDSIFDDMTDKEFEDILIKSNFNFTRTDKGDGGVLYNGKVHKNIDELDKAFESDAL